MAKLYSEEFLLDHLRWLGSPPDDAPSYPDVEYAIGPDPRTYIHRFGSFHAALAEAGYTDDAIVANRRVYTDEELLDQLRELGDVPDDPPTCEEIQAADDVADQSTFNTRFGSVTTALVEAGYAEGVIGTRTNPDDLIDDLRVGATLLGHSPSCDEYKRYGLHSHRTLYTHLAKTWEGVLEAADLPPSGEPVDMTVEELLMEDEPA